MNFDKIQAFAVSLVSSMSEAEARAYSRHEFLTSFTHPAFTAYGDTVELLDCLDVLIAQRIPAAAKRKVEWSEAA